MPLTENQITQIMTFLDGTGAVDEKTLNQGINALIEGREDLYGLLRLNADIATTSCSAVITRVKAKINTAIADLTVLMGSLP